MAGARLHTSYVGTEHLLIAILEDGQSYAMRFLQLLGVDPNRIISELSSVLNNTSFPAETAMPPVRESRVRAVERRWSSLDVI